MMDCASLSRVLDWTAGMATRNVQNMLYVIKSKNKIKHYEGNPHSSIE